VKVARGLSILWIRLREQGVTNTFLWGLDHLVRRLTGAPMERVSRITPLIHVGGQYKRRGWKRLTERGIQAVVNLRTEFDDSAAGTAPADYLYLPTVDDTPPTLDQLERGVEFIQQCVDQGKGVYIHCASGVGRAPTMAAAYFVSQGLSSMAAMQKVADQRPFIRMLPEQIEKLRQFEMLQESAES